MMMKRICALSMLVLLTMLAIPRTADAQNFRVEVFNATDKCVWMTIDAGLVKRTNRYHGGVKPREHISFFGENESRMQVRAQFWPTAECNKGNFIQDRYDNFSGNMISHFVLTAGGNTYHMTPTGH